MSQLVDSPVNLWLRLQCRPVLDPAIFPQLATLTAGRCLQLLYQYELCETEDGVEASEEQRVEFEAAHAVIANHQQHNIGRPLPLRPTNAVYALQPHLSSEFIELPLTALTTPPPTTINQPPSAPAFGLPASSSSSHTLPSPPTDLLVRLAELYIDLFRHCLDYLDTNSLLFGLLPAVHSLPRISAALTSSSYGRRVLLARYGAYSDVGLWDEAVLSEWRSEGFHVQKQDVMEKYDYDLKVADALCEQVDEAESRANKRDIFWATVYDMHARINKFVVRVMLQHEEDILPQLYQRPQQHAPASPNNSSVSSAAPALPLPGTVRPTFLTPADAALELLLCYPPFYPVPAWILRDIYTNRKCQLEHTILNASPHHVDFAGFIQWNIASSDYSIWSLYMGPVYVYENEHTAGRGNALNVAQMAPPEDERSRRVVDEIEKESGGRGVRELYIDDVNLLPVTCRMPFEGRKCIYMYAPTLAACFRAKGVSAKIEQTRIGWRLIANKLIARANHMTDMTLQMMAAAQEEGKISEEGKQDEREVEEVGEDESHDDFCKRWTGGDDDVMHDNDGAVLEFAMPLVRALFEQLDVELGFRP